MVMQAMNDARISNENLMARLRVFFKAKKPSYWAAYVRRREISRVFRDGRIVNQQVGECQQSSNLIVRYPE